MVEPRYLISPDLVAAVGEHATVLHALYGEEDYSGDGRKRINHAALMADLIYLVYALEFEIPNYAEPVTEADEAIERNRKRILERISCIKGEVEDLRRHVDETYTLGALEDQATWRADEDQEGYRDFTAWAVESLDSLARKMRVNEQAIASSLGSLKTDLDDYANCPDPVSGAPLWLNSNGEVIDLGQRIVSHVKLAIVRFDRLCQAWMDIGSDLTVPGNPLHDVQPQEEIFFHGTTSNDVGAKIQTSGLKPSGWGAYGRGAYATPYLETASEYTDDGARTLVNKGPGPILKSELAHGVEVLHLYKVGSLGLKDDFADLFEARRVPKELRDLPDFPPGAATTDTWGIWAREHGYRATQIHVPRKEPKQGHKKHHLVAFDPDALKILLMVDITNRNHPNHAWWRNRGLLQRRTDFTSEEVRRTLKPRLTNVVGNLDQAAELLSEPQQRTRLRDNPPTPRDPQSPGIQVKGEWHGESRARSAARNKALPDDVGRAGTYYYDAAEREELVAHPDCVSGRLLLKNGKPFPSGRYGWVTDAGEKSNRLYLFDPKAIAVTDRDGNSIFGKKFIPLGTVEQFNTMVKELQRTDIDWYIEFIHHSSVLAGANVGGAGEIIIEEGGYIESMTNKSGHYEPGSEDMYQALGDLSAAGYDIVGERRGKSPTVEIIGPNGNTEMTAAEFLSGPADLGLRAARKEAANEAAATQAVYREHLDRSAEVRRIRHEETVEAEREEQRRQRIEEFKEAHPDTHVARFDDDGEAVLYSTDSTPISTYRNRSPEDSRTSDQEIEESDSLEDPEKSD
ncbi:hypothetical protein [Kitasatospora sp. MBT63]|uniref:hypothetical protein n=1 Tax=Kitasatospora sp. MBT63 TaxID=1444768 RepID=UPI00053AC3AE|nr:hypothetical protein [Kitasatospora sp. MBT63]